MVLKRKIKGFRNAVDTGSKIAKGASGKALDKVSDTTSKLSKSINNPSQKQMDKVKNAMSQLSSNKLNQMVGNSGTQEITARLRGKTTKSPKLPISNRSKIAQSTQDITASQKAKGLFPSANGWVPASPRPSNKVRKPRKSEKTIKTRNNKERMAPFNQKQAEKARVFQHKQTQERMAGSNAKFFKEKQAQKRSYEAVGENVSSSRTNLSNLFTTSAERLVADGSFKSIGASMGKAAVAGGLVGGTVNAVRGEDFWEGAGRGAIMGGAYGGISRGIKIAANAPKGSSMFQAMSDLNQEHNVSQSVKTLMRDQKLRRQSANVAGNTM